MGAMFPFVVIGVLAIVWVAVMSLPFILAGFGASILATLVWYFVQSSVDKAFPHIQEQKELAAAKAEQLQIEATIEREIQQAVAAAAEEEARRPKTADEAHQKLMEAREAVAAATVALAVAEAGAKTTSGGWQVVC